MDLKQEIFNTKKIRVFITQGVLQIIYAITLVFCFIWVLTQIAISNSEKPQKLLFENGKKQLLLTLFNASVEGDLEFEPMLLENQKNDFEYMYGRDLYKERKDRVVNTWKDYNASLSWLVVFNQKVEIQLKITGEQSTNQDNVVKLYFNNQLQPLKKVKLSNGTGVFKTYYNTHLSIERVGIYKIEVKLIDPTETEVFQFKSISLKIKK